MATKLSYDQPAIELGRVALSRDELRFELYDVKQERDTYRELCGELIEYLKDFEKSESVPRLISASIIAKAEGILNAT